MFKPDEKLMAAIEKSAPEMLAAIRAEHQKTEAPAGPRIHKRRRPRLRLPLI